MIGARSGFRLLVATALAVFSIQTASAQWSAAQTNSSASLRGIHNVGEGTIWASGTNATVLRSEDEGYVWQQCTPPGKGADAAKLDFRGIYGWDANHAVVMSSGTGAASRLYETNDGCASWHLLFENPDREGFWDAVTFRGKSGFLFGDAVNGRFAFYRSNDGGQHWQRDSNSGPAAELAGEGLFAASNSSFVVLPKGDLLVGTGGPGGPRILRLSNRVWTTVKIPLSGGQESAGVFSLAFRDDTHGIAVGGDYKRPAEVDGTAAWTADGGQTWHAAKSSPSGYRSSVAWDQKLHAWIAVGPNGSDLSVDDGRTWKRFDSTAWNALSLPWVAGPNGRIASLDRASPPFTKVAAAIGARPLQ